MWAGMLHLTLGNALIGIGEGLLISRVFQLPKRRCIGWMIAANYLSAWVGGIGLNMIASKLDWNLYNAWGFFWMFVAATYVVTILLEWPLVALCFWGQEKKLPGSFKASLLAQSVSYVLLFGWYWGASGKSLYTQMKVVPASDIKLPANVRLFYIADRDGRVHEADHSIGIIASTNKSDRLLIRPTPGQTNTWTLMLRLDADRDENAQLVAVESAIEGAMAAVEPSDEYRKNGRDTWFNFGPALRLGEEKKDGWNIRTGFWAVEGMRARNEKTGETFHFAWETPFSQWVVRSAIQLPDDHLIFQLGDDQICVLEPSTQRVALLARGRGPTVVLK